MTVFPASRAFQDPVTREREEIENKAIPAGRFVKKFVA